MALTVLSVGFPFAPVGPDAVGGAEQVLSLLDAALVDAGHRSLVIAPEASRIRGELLALPAPPDELDTAAWWQGHAAVRARLAEVLQREHVDLLHFHGFDFHRYLPSARPPAVVTLHLPPEWHPEKALQPRQGEVHLVCVSESQRRRCPPGARIDEVIPNGVDLEALRPRFQKRGFALCLGRVCPEKGVHHALEAAHEAEAALLVAGQVFGHAEHRDYFAREVRPRLDARRRFIGPVGLDRKRRLLASAKCVLVPSLAPETSSLVAMEALACGTPVIAFPAGALAELVEPGRTGFLVEDAKQMARAIREVERLRPEDCRRAAEARFSARTTAERYLELYQRLARRPPRPSRLEHLHTLDALRAIRAPWSALCDRDPRATPFQRPEWLLAWCHHFGRRTPLGLASWRGASLEALLVLDATDGVLRPAGSGVSDHLEPLGDPQALGPLLAELRGAPLEWDALGPETPLAGLGSLEPSEPTPVLPLPASLPARLASNLRQARRRAEQLGPVRFETATAERLDALLDALFRLHAARWGSRGQPGVLAEGHVERFHREAARGLLQRGLLRLHALSLGERVAAVFYGFAEKDRTFYYLGGFDPALAKLSPGALVLAHAIEQATREGCTTFDFLRGAEPYKYAWGAVDVPGFRLRVEARARPATST